MHLCSDRPNGWAVVHKHRPPGDAGVLVYQPLQPGSELTRLPAPPLQRVHAWLGSCVCDLFAAA